MHQIPATQFSTMRQTRLAEALAATFNGPQTGSIDSETGDVLATDPHGHSTRFSFDDQGFIGQVTSPMKRQWQLENNPKGRLLSLTNPAGLKLGIDYDTQSHQQPIQITQNHQPKARFSYDKAHQLSAIDHLDGTQSTFTWTAPDVLHQYTNRLSHTQTYQRNNAGDITAITDANDNTTKFDYSQWNRPDQAKFPDGRQEHYRYDDQGRVNQILTGTDHELLVELHYPDDATTRPSELHYRDGEIIKYTYDDKGNILSAENPEALCQYQYNDQGRLLQEDCNGQITHCHYDEAGTQTGITYPNGQAVRFEWDADLRLSAVHDWQGGKYRYAYTNDDLNYAWRAPNGLTTHIKQNAQGKPTEIITQTTRHPPHFEQHYAYDNEDRLTSARDEHGEQQYHYDAESQLLAVEGARAETFAYDAAGNRTTCNQQSAQFDTSNRLLAQGDLKCQYDAHGNLKTRHQGGTTWQFTYNARNLLISAHSNYGAIITYGYDAFGRRLWKRTNDQETRYYWLGEHLIGETTHTTPPNTTTPPQIKHYQWFLYHPDSYTPIATLIDGKTYTYHTDHLGSPIKLTDPQGNIAWSAQYQAYGEVNVHIHTVNNPLRRPGQYHDEDTGLYYNRFRYYDPTAGRYISPDPLTFLAGNHFYAYVGNNPITQVDPLGLFWRAVASFAAAAVVGVAVGMAVVALAPLVLGVAAATAAAVAVTSVAIVAGGAAAGAVGYGAYEALTQEEFCLQCIGREMRKGALVGGISALPFAFLPAAAGIAAYTGTGALSGAIGHVTNHAMTPDAKWNWGEFATSVSIGAATAGIGRFVTPKLTNWWRQRRAPSNPRRIPSTEFTRLTNDFADNVTSNNFRTWKQGLLDQGYRADTIQDIVHHGSLTKGANIWGDDWARYYSEISGTTIPRGSMTRPHAHHQVEKIGGGAPGVLNRAILEEVGISPLLSRHNLDWAPNVAGQHGAGPQRQLLEALLPVRGDRTGIIDVLSNWKSISTNR